MSEHESTPSSCGCALNGLFETLARPWTLHILWTLNHHGPMRFGVLKRAIEGISSRMLTERLRTLEEKRFVHRDYKPTIPPQVTYRLTERMDDFHVIMGRLHELSQKWQEEDRALAAVPAT